MKKLFFISAVLLLSTMATWAQTNLLSFTIWPEVSGPFEIRYSTYNAPSTNVMQADWGDGVVQTFNDKVETDSDPTKLISGTVTVGKPIKIYSNCICAIWVASKAKFLKCENNNPNLRYIYYFHNNISAIDLEAFYMTLKDRGGKNWGELHLADDLESLLDPTNPVLKTNAFSALDKHWYICSMNRWSGGDTKYRTHYYLDEGMAKANLIPAITLQLQTGETELSIRIGIKEDRDCPWEVEASRIRIMDGDNNSFSLEATRQESNLNLGVEQTEKEVKGVVKIYGALISQIQTYYVSEANISGTNNLRHLSVENSPSLTEIVGLDMQKNLQLISLSKDTAFQQIDFSNLGELTNLYVSKCPNLSFLNLGAARQLKEIDVSDSGWDACEIDEFYSNLPDKSGGINKIRIENDFYFDNNDYLGANHTIAINKAWSVYRWLFSTTREVYIEGNGGGCQTEPELSFTIYPEETSAFKLKYSTKDAPLNDAVFVDWGDGVLISYGKENDGGTNPTKLITGSATAGKAIKVYSHYIEAFDIQTPAKAIQYEANNPVFRYFYYHHNNLSAEALEHLYSSLNDRTKVISSEGELHLSEELLIENADDAILKSNVFIAIEKKWCVCSTKALTAGSIVDRTRWIMRYEDASTHLIPAITLQSPSTDDITDLQLGIKAKPDYPFNVATTLITILHGTRNFKSVSVKSFATDTEFLSEPALTVQGSGTTEVIKIYGALVSHIKTNQINMLDLNNTNNLRYIYLNNCDQLTTIPGLSNQNLLYHLDLDNSLNLTSVDVANSSELKTLRVSNCQGLDSLYFNIDSLELLSISQCANLGSNISDMKNASKLTNLYANNLGLDACGLDALYGQLPSVNGTANIYVNNVEYTTPANDWKGSNKTIANDKGWIVYHTGIMGKNPKVIVITGDGGGCNPSGISDVEAEKFITLYPNPATDIVKVSIQQNLNAKSLQVLDITGQKIYSMPITSSEYEHQINVSTYNKGIYLIRIGNITRKLFVK